MREKISIAAALLCLVLSPAARAGTIAGSPHDFRGYGKNQSGEVCEPCHTPHRTGALPLPLWQQDLTTDTYSLYKTTESLTLGQEEKELRPSGSSKECLSCHDGTLAPETFGKVSDTGGCLRGGASFGEPMGMNHPISFVYDAALAAREKGLFDPSKRLSGIAGSKKTIRDDMLLHGEMQCASCHDVHNTRAVPGTKLLYKDNAGSALCLTCHNK